MYIYIYIYIQDRWRDDPPPCLHCVLIIVFKASQNKQAAFQCHLAPAAVTNRLFAFQIFLHMRFLEGSWYQQLGTIVAFGCLLKLGSGRFLGFSLGFWYGSCKVLGRLLEALQKHFGPAIVVATIFKGFVITIGQSEGSSRKF